MKKNIDLTTTQNVIIQYDLATLRERILAWLLDLLFILVGLILTTISISTIFGGNVFSGMSGVLIYVAYFMSIYLYHVLFEILNNGQSLGKRALQIQVVRLDGKELEWSDVLLRGLLLQIDAVFSMGLIGSLLIKTTAQNQRLGDMAAHTTVIQLFNSSRSFRLQDILKIASLDTYQPVYPQVRNLSEKDMLFIKTVLTRYQRFPNNAHLAVVEDLVTHLMPLLKLEQRPYDRLEFLKTLLRDYIVLTR